ncbi:hypothetical protein C2G38_1977432, partial [Gigaspora rosea]
EREQENAALQHCIEREIFESNFLSPINCGLKEGGLKVLDVGCELGTWLFEMSSDFPNCTFIGVDIAPTPFTVKPNNVDFVTLVDVTNGLPFKDESFDFIFIRNVFFLIY